MKKGSSFRLWVENIWRENCKECLEWKEQEPSLATYWNKYKWWLKREFRFQKSKDV